MFDSASADRDYCYLVTTGRSTGQPHEIEIWFAASDGTLYLLSGGGDRSDWVRNLRAEPAVSVRLDGVTYAATARVVDDPAERRRARDLVFSKYQPRYSGNLESWRESALPVAIDVETE